MKKKSIWFGSAAVLILFACWLLMQSGSKPQSEGEMTSKPKSARAASNDEDLARERTARRKASGRVLPEGSITTHQPEQLKDFVLTECKGHQVSLRTALKLIDEAYQDACYFSLEKPLKLKYEIDGESDKLLNFSLKGKSWLSAVEYVAALAGMEIKCDGEKVTLSTMEDADEPQQMKTSISPELLEQLQQTLRDLGLSENTTSDPQASITTLLSLNSIIENAQVVYQPDIGILAVNGTVRECNALGTMIKLGEVNFKQIKTITKLISTKNPLEISQNTLSPTELQELMRQLSQQKGIELVSAPSFMSRNGQDALIEIKQGSDDQWTGLELKYNTTYIGLKLASANQTEMRPKEGEGQNQQAEMQLLVYDGDSQITNIGVDDLGHHYQITTIQRIDATGRPLKKNALHNSGTEITRESIDAIINYPNRNAAVNPSSVSTATAPIAKPVPGKPGFVFSPFNNHIVDLTGIAPGTLVADPQYPASEKKHFRAP
jgi:hypothetical protein